VKRSLFILFLITSSFAFTQVYVKSISNDSIPLWKTDKYFVYEYCMKNMQHDVSVEFIDDLSDSDSLHVKYSLNNNFVSSKTQLPLGLSKMKVWVRLNVPVENLALHFKVLSDSVIYEDSIRLNYGNRDGEFLFQNQVTDWIDFKSDRYEKIELQLYDSLWNVVSTLDSNSDRIMVRNLKEGRYFLKSGTTIIAFDKIKPADCFSEQSLSHGTDQ